MELNLKYLSTINLRYSGCDRSLLNVISELSAHHLTETCVYSNTLWHCESSQINLIPEPTSQSESRERCPTMPDSQRDGGTPNHLSQPVTKGKSQSTAPHTGRDSHDPGHDVQRTESHPVSKS